jgi:hypothetical protein
VDGEPLVSIVDSKHDIAKAVVKLQCTVGNIAQRGQVRWRSLRALKPKQTLWSHSGNER